MPVNDIEGARAALHAGRVADLLGLAECGWLDVKAGVYQLDDPAKSLELAKDVSAFADAKSGGVIRWVMPPGRSMVRNSWPRFVPFPVL